MTSERFWRSMRRRVMPALVSVAAIAVTVAAVVFIVDTVGGDADDDAATLSLDLGDGELDALARRLRLDGFDRLDGLDARALGELLPEELARALAGGAALGGGAVLGVSVDEVDGQLVVEEVAPGSPADDAGIAPGDAIERVDGERVRTIGELREALAAVAPGAEYRVTTNRDGRRETLELERAELAAGNLAGLLERLLVTPFEVETQPARPPNPQPEVRPARPAPPFGDVAAGPPLLGVQAAQTDAGVRVTGVIPGLGAEQAGIRAGDRIVAVNGERIVSVAQLGELLAQAEVGEVVRVEIDRDGHREQVRVQLASPVPAVQGEFRFVTPDGRERRFGFGAEVLDAANGEQLRELLQQLPPELRFRLEQLLGQLIEEGEWAPFPQPSSGASSS